MADLTKLQAFAADGDHPFGLTAPLSHADVDALAQYWRPYLFFHPDERFHPIAMDEALSMVETLFSQTPASAQGQWRVAKAIRSTAGVSVAAFDPPVVYVPDGVVFIGNSQAVPVVRVLNSGTPALDALSLKDVDTGAAITHGASFKTSDQFFGALKTLNGGNHAGDGDPFIPRAEELVPGSTDQRRPHITVMAALLNLIDLLKYELHVEAAGKRYPPDGLRRGFDIKSRLIRSSGTTLIPAEAIRKFLLDMIASHESPAVPAPALPSGWRFDRRAWDAVTRYAFLEFYFFYAYNDFERYQTAIFDNEHEGDDEGCCVVFDRGALNLAASSPDRDAALRRVVPHSIITSVHEEWQHGDQMRFVPPPANASVEARDVIVFDLYIAGGSHATYFTSGDHDLVDFDDYTGWIEEEAPFLPLLVSPGIIVGLLITLSILEHFIDTKDFTSEEGVHGVAEGELADHPTGVVTQVKTLPMSADSHIYSPQDPDQERLLALRAFAGKWGGHDGLVDKSPPFTPKTARYFRKLLDSL